MSTTVATSTIIGVGQDKHGRIGMVVTTGGNGYAIEDLYDSDGAPVQVSKLLGGAYENLVYKPRKGNGQKGSNAVEFYADKKHTS